MPVYVCRKCNKPLPLPTAPDRAGKGPRSGEPPARSRAVVVRCPHCQSPSQLDVPEGSAAPDGPEVIVGAEPLPDNLDQFEWAEQARRSALAAAEGSLQRLVILTGALLAGGAALSALIPLPFWARAGSPVLLLTALGSSLWGSLPREGSLRIHYPDEVKAFRERALSRKTVSLKVAGWCLFLAFAVLIAGLCLGSRAP